MNGPAGGDAASARHVLGVALVLLGATCLSTGGIALRHVESANGWQILFYRAVTFVTVFSLALALRHRRGVVAAFLRIGWPGVLVAMSLGAGAMCYVQAILLTKVANVMLILSVAPFATALLARLVLGERVVARTWLAMAVALGGIAVMFAGGLRSGGISGMLVAVLAVCTYSTMIVVLRWRRHVDMLPAVCLAGVVTACASGALAGDLVVSAHDLSIGVFLGTVQFGGGFVLITLGTRHVPAAQVALLGMAEVVLAPFWVWIGVGEAPTAATLVGGSLVLAAVLGEVLRALRAERRRRDRVVRDSPVSRVPR